MWMMVSRITLSLHPRVCEVPVDIERILVAETLGSRLPQIVVLCSYRRKWRRERATTLDGPHPHVLLT